MATTARRTRRPAANGKPDVDDVYPYSDGEPMGESQPHVDAIRTLLDALDDLFWDDDNVSVHGNVHWYWRKGDIRLTRAPDAMVIPGVPMDFDRRSYKSWEYAGRVPTAIIETASYKTYRANLTEVKQDYEANGVREYFLFDAARLYLPDPLMGFRLHRRSYREIPVETDGSMVSRELGVRLRPEARFLRLIDRRTGEPLPTRPERIAFYQARVAEQERQLRERDARIDEMQRRLAERDQKLADREDEVARLAELLRRAGIDPKTGKGG